MANILRNLISKHFYSTKEEAQSKVDVVYGMGKISSEQYAELCALIEEKYPEEPETEVE